jgi:pyruvate dehydrogenase E2 component (dihydrolipoamide acetyltransferase)
MAITIEMPRLSDTMEEGTLLKWHVAQGDAVASGDHIADVETDKATMEVQAFDDGTIAALPVDEGATVAVGEVIAVLAEEGEDPDQAAKAATSGGGKPKPTDDAKDADDAGSADTAAGDPHQGDSTGGQMSTAVASAGPVKASPLARKLAEEHGLDIASIDGSGPGGRVIKRDVLAAAEAGPSGGPAVKPAPADTPRSIRPATPDRPAASTAPTLGGGSTLEAREVAVSGMRKTIAKRLVESKTTVPHFQVTTSVNMAPLMSLRKTLNAQLEQQGVKLTVNDFIVRGTAVAAERHPVINASWMGDKIVYHGTVNVGVAIALPEERGGGLVVATLKGVEAMGLRQISAESKRLGGKARDSGLSTDEMADATITVSNLGAPQFGEVTQFTAIVNPPNAAILAIGSVLTQPVVVDGELAVGQRMSITLSGDHRVIDGASGALYLSSLKQTLENPASLLV